MSNYKIMLRIQSSEGTKRVELSLNSSLRDLYEIVREAFNIPNYVFAIYKERNFVKELVSTRSQTLLSNNIKHGDMIYMKMISGLPSTSSSTVSVNNNTNVNQNLMLKNDASFVKSNEIIEDEVDVILSKIDGKIKRERDTKLCRHNLNGSCVHCSPLEPYDEDYLKEQNIKHISFNSFLRKQMSGIDRGKFVVFDDLNCRIKPGCKDHPPWPKGICSKCQPSAITLNRQIYRHVDNVMFENTALVERFLNYWRTSGHQRIGILYGKYETHSDVPLGIRAVVAAIYEPPQEGNRDLIRLLRDENQQDVDEVGNFLGLQRIGWIFTDLISDDATAGTVKHIRGIETHFLTAEECIMAGSFQNQHPNPCKYSPNGVFGSKFVTVCVTGDKTKQVHMEGYAVSAQCMGLVRDEILLPTINAPHFGYIRESSDKKYVPDVYYKEKDQYGNEVQRLGRPLPVEYLLVDVPASTPITPIYTFNACDIRNAFPVENRLIDGHLQGFNELSMYLSKWKPEEFLDAMSDFHLLIYLYKMDMLPMKNNMQLLFNAVKTKNRELAFQFKNEEVWKTLESLVSANSMQSNDGGQSHMSSNTDSWTCNHCTFINPQNARTCEICALPQE